MEHLQLTVLGERAGTVPSALKSIPEDERFDYDGDGFAVIATEQFFYRINSSVGAAAVFDLVDGDRVEVTLLSAGGAAGLAKDDLDAEQTILRDLAADIEAYCETHGLTVEE